MVLRSKCLESPKERGEDNLSPKFDTICQAGFRAENVLPFVEASPRPSNPVLKGRGFKASQGDMATKNNKMLGDRDEDLPNREGKALSMSHILVGKPANLAKVRGEPSLSKGCKKLVEHNLSRIKTFSNKINIIKEGKGGDPKVLNVNPLTLKKRKMVVPP